MWSVLNHFGVCEKVASDLVLYDFFPVLPWFLSALATGLPLFSRYLAEKVMMNAIRNFHASPKYGPKYTKHDPTLFWVCLLPVY